jgi:hypothetical protein
MSQFIAGLVVVGDKTTVVYAEVPDDADAPVTILSDDSWKMQIGARGSSLDYLYKRVKNFFGEHPINLIVVKGSAVTQGKATLALLESAEARGAVIAAAASVTNVSVLTKASISKSYRHAKYPKRDVDEIVDDDVFWDAEVGGTKLRKTSREAALLILASRGS